MDRAKKAEAAEQLQFAKQLCENADRVLAVKLDDLVLPDCRVPQVVVGLCRAAFAQCKVIALLANENLLFETAPNRRLFIESVIRLCWIRSVPVEDRNSAVDSMLSQDRDALKSTLSYLDTNNFHIDFDPTEMFDFPLTDSKKGPLQEQAKKLRQAVNASKLDIAALYAMWRDTTMYSHASGALAGTYAPTFDQIHLSLGKPEITNSNLKIYVYLQLLAVSITSDLLLSQDVDQDLANRFQFAFFSV